MKTFGVTCPSLTLVVHTPVADAELEAVAIRASVAVETAECLDCAKKQPVQPPLEMHVDVLSLVHGVPLNPHMLLQGCFPSLQPSQLN